MNAYRKIVLTIPMLLLIACTRYVSPDRSTWPAYLRGASYNDMTETERIAKRPVYLGSGGHLVTNEKMPLKLNYGDKNQNDNILIIHYMTALENELYNSLLKPGMSVQRAGTDVTVVLVRDAIMDISAPEISVQGDDTLIKIAKILNKYDATFIEISGYTDAMTDKNASNALSTDMAKRVAVHLSQHKINPFRMFIIGRGPTRPIAGQDDIGRRMNRRVEIRITPAR